MSFCHPRRWFFHLKVIKDWHPGFRGVQPAPEASEDLETPDEFTAAGLRILLDRDLAQDAEARKQRRRELEKKYPQQARHPNKSWLRHIDFSMRQVRSHGLGIFRPRRAVGPLQENQTLYFAEVPDDHIGGTRRRACIYDDDRKTAWLALAENADDQGNVDCPVWHVVVDFASVGMPGLVYLKNGPPQLRMTALPDRLHQLMCCWNLGVTDARLMLRRIEFKPLCTLRFGPFGRQAHHGVLTEAAADFFAKNGHRAPLF